MEGERSELTSNFKGVNLLLKSDSSIFIENKSSEKFKLTVFNPVCNYYGYVHNNFQPGTWCSTNPPKWETGWTTGAVEVILTGIDYEFKFLVDICNRKIEIYQDEFNQIEDFQIKRVGISFVISAYKTQNYINSTLESIIKLKKNFIDIEIIVGVDSCGDVFKKITETEYPEFVKIYFFPENVGVSLVINTLVKKTKYENVIKFDSDDLPHKDLLKHFIKEIKQNDVVNWGHYIFNEGEEIDETKMEIRKKGMGCLGFKKNLFISMNGFYPWRCQSDSEFQERLLNSKCRIKNLDIPLFYYRILNTSLSRSELTSKGSTIRNTYISIMDEKRVSGSWNNPSRLYTSECVRIK